MVAVAGGGCPTGGEGGTLGFCEGMVWLADGHIKASPAALKTVVCRSVRLTAWSGGPTIGLRADKKTELDPFYVGALGRGFYPNRQKRSAPDEMDRRGFSF